jgi:hypothetical protein
MDGIQCSGDKVTIDVAKINSAIEAYNAKRRTTIETFDPNSDSFRDFLHYLEIYHRDIVRSEVSLTESLL